MQLLGKRGVLSFGMSSGIRQGIDVPPENNEKELIEQAKKDPEAFGVLYEKYVTKIYNYVYFHTNNHEEAEDLTARTFHRALNKINSYVDRGAPFSAWLYRIAHNLIANWYRDNSRRKTISIEDVSLVSIPEEGPHQQTERKEQRQMLLETIRQLPYPRRLLLFLKFSEGLSNAEIGRIMGRSEGAIKSLYHRTLRALRDRMVEYPELGDTVAQVGHETGNEQGNGAQQAKARKVIDG
jgi:RNA polymerase sigma-70 factor, ECF subfamily